tara:strand:+ start:10088 stop:10699 length:612 start_codon:yes stop_codon:yes gene_type:complete
MSFLLVGVAAVGVIAGGAKAISGASKKKKAKAAHADAKAQMKKDKEAYMNLDTSNPYLDMENTMEDLTVNTQAAEFAAEQSQQSTANVLDGMKGAAGGSGIAALAQAMANQGQIAAQKASVSIGEQEMANQSAERTEAGNIQNLEREGEIQSRNLKKDMAATALGMSSAETQNEAANISAADKQMWDGIESGASSIGTAVGGV